MTVNLASLLNLGWTYGPLLKQLCLQRCLSCAFSWVVVLVPVLFSLVMLCLTRGRLLVLRAQPGTWAMHHPLRERGTEGPFRTSLCVGAEENLLCCSQWLRDQPVCAERASSREAPGLCHCCPSILWGMSPQHFRKKKDFAAIVIAKPKKMFNLLEVPVLLGIAPGGREVSSFIEGRRMVGFQPVGLLLSLAFLSRDFLVFFPLTSPGSGLDH